MYTVILKKWLGDHNCKIYKIEKFENWKEVEDFVKKSECTIEVFQNKKNSKTYLITFN